MAVKRSSKPAPAFGGPLDGGAISGRMAFYELEDGSLYRWNGTAWVFCGPRAGRCRDCGAFTYPKPGDNSVYRCWLCGGSVRLPGEQR